MNFKEFTYNGIKFVEKNSFWIVFWVLLFLKCGYYLFDYGMIIDDWFLYGTNGMIADKWNELIIPFNMLALRPLAGLLDIFVISVLQNSLWVISLCISLMLGFSAYLFHKVLCDLKVSCGSIFIIILVFLPLGMEATYWISAASRIVTSLFLISISGYMVNLYLKKGTPWHIILFAVFSMLSFGLYELAIPLSIAYTTLIVILNRKNNRQFWTLIIPTINSILIALYYMLSSSSELEKRGSLVSSDYIHHTKEVLNSIFYVFGDVQTNLLYYGFTNGISVILHDRAVIYVISILVFSILFGITSVKKFDSPTSVKRSLILGILLAGAGIVLNFSVDFIRISIRVVFFSLIGIAIFIDVLFSRLGRYVYGVITAVLVFIFTITCIGELNYYKTTHDLDVNIARQLIESSTGDKLISKDYISVLLGAKESYFDYSYYEHIKSATESYASLSGVIKMELHDNDINQIIPIFNNGLFKKNISMELYNFYFMDLNNKIHTAVLNPLQNDYEIISEQGIPYGILIWQGENVYNFVAQ